MAFVGAVKYYTNSNMADMHLRFLIMFNNYKKKQVLGEMGHVREDLLSVLPL